MELIAFSEAHAFTTLSPLHEVLRTCDISKLENLGVCPSVLIEHFVDLLPSEHLNFTFYSLMDPWKASKQIANQPRLASLKDYATCHLPPFTSLCVFLCFTLSPDHPAIAQHPPFALSSASVFLVSSYFNIFDRYIAFSVSSEISFYQLVVLNLLSREEIGYCLFNFPFLCGIASVK